MIQRRTLVLLLTCTPLAGAHTGPALSDAQLPAPARQFGLPFKGPAGPDTWLLGQGYGNTTGAYRMRNSDYRAGQGIHFGLDFSAPCGTPVVAIGDGVVQEVDGTHGSPPHNLVINHGNGLSSLYGHLLERPSLKVGQRVKRGQVVARSGDSQNTCRSAPHLHLEIRDSSHVRFFNPLLYIDADWDTLALQGSFGRGFQRDLADIRKWQFPDRQPQARRGGALLNNFRLTWPPLGPQQTPQGGNFAGYQPVEKAWPTSETRLTEAGCCVGPVFAPDSTQVLYLDQPAGNAALGWYGVRPGNKPRALLPIGQFSPTLQHQVLPFGSQGTVVRRLKDRKTLTLPAGPTNVLWSPDERRLAWNVSAQQGRFDERITRVQVAAFGSQPRTVATLYGGGAQGFLDSDTLVTLGKTQPSQTVRALRVLDLSGGKSTLLEEALNIRGISIAPGGKWLAYYLAFEEKKNNGLYVTNAQGRKVKVPLFGSYRWRDGQTLLLVPLKATNRHVVYQWKVGEPEARPLLTLQGKISHDQWNVSADGKNLVYLRSQTRSLYGIRLP